MIKTAEEQKREKGRDFNPKIVALCNDYSIAKSIFFQNGDTPLHIAVALNFRGLVEMLLFYKASVFIRNKVCLLKKMCSHYPIASDVRDIEELRAYTLSTHAAMGEGVYQLSAKYTAKSH